MRSGKLLPAVPLLNRLDRVAVSLISQQFYLKLPFLLINIYTIFTRQRVYLVTIISTITYIFLLLLNLKQYLVPLPLFWCFNRKRGCYNLDRSIYHFWLWAQAICQKESSITPYYEELSIFHSQFQFIQIHTNPISNFRCNPISSHPIFRFFLNLVP